MSLFKYFTVHSFLFNHNANIFKKWKVKSFMSIFYFHKNWVIRTELLNLLVDKMEEVSWDKSYLSGCQSDDSVILCLQHITFIIKANSSKCYPEGSVRWHLTICTIFTSNQLTSFNNIGCLSNPAISQLCDMWELFITFPICPEHLSFD